MACSGTTLLFAVTHLVTDLNFILLYVHRERLSLFTLISAGPSMQLLLSLWDKLLILNYFHFTLFVFRATYEIELSRLVF
jgi:hypothetical protein